LLGDFSVESLSEYSFAEKKAVFTNGPFYLSDRKNQVSKGDITTEGYPFFSGRMKLAFNFRAIMEDGEKYVLNLEKPNCPVSNLFVNGEKVSTLMWEPFDLDLTDYISEGDNLVEIEFVSSLRNVFGPHHYIGGESHFVGVSTFSDKPGWSETDKGNIWIDRYCFVKFGL